MQTKLVTCLLAVSFVSSVASAQTRPALEERTPTKEASVTIPAPEPTLPVRCGVKGMTRTNESALKLRLTALKIPVYTCDPCKIALLGGTTCTKCGGALQKTERATLKEVTTDVDHGVIILVPDSRIPTRLSDVVRSLEKDTVQVDYGALSIGQYAQLEVADVGPADVAALQDGLIGAHVFVRVHGSFDERTSLVILQVASSSTPPTHAAVSAALQQLNARAKLVDVVYGPATATY